MKDLVLLFLQRVIISNSLLSAIGKVCMVLSNCLGDICKRIFINLAWKTEKMGLNGVFNSRCLLFCKTLCIYFVLYLFLECVHDAQTQREKTVTMSLLYEHAIYAFYLLYVIWGFDGRSIFLYLILIFVIRIQPCWILCDFLKSSLYKVQLS